MGGGFPRPPLFARRRSFRSLPPTLPSPLRRSRPRSRPSSSRRLWRPSPWRGPLASPPRSGVRGQPTSGSRRRLPDRGRAGGRFRPPAPWRLAWRASGTSRRGRGRTFRWSARRSRTNRSSWSSLSLWSGPIPTCGWGWSCSSAKWKRSFVVVLRGCRRRALRTVRRAPPPSLSCDSPATPVKSPPPAAGFAGGSGAAARFTGLSPLPQRRAGGRAAATTTTEKQE